MQVAVFRVGTESREGLSVRPFLDEDALKRMPRRSFLITNPLPDEVVCEHDLVFCLVYSQTTWTSLKVCRLMYTSPMRVLFSLMLVKRAQHSLHPLDTTSFPHAPIRIAVLCHIASHRRTILHSRTNQAH